MKVEWLKNRNRHLEMNRKILDFGLINQIIESETSNCQKTIQDIHTQRESLKREVDKHALKLITRIRASISKEEKKVLIN